MTRDTQLIVGLLALALGHLSDGWMAWVWYSLVFVYAAIFIAMTVLDWLDRRDRLRRLSDVEF